MDERTKGLLWLALAVGAIVSIPFVGDAFAGGMAGLGSIGRGHVSRRARTFVQKKIRKLRHEGYPQQQAIRVAHEMARKRGFSV